MSVFLLLNNTALFLTPFPVSGTQHKESDGRSKENIPKAPERQGMSPAEPSAAGFSQPAPGAVWSRFPTWNHSPLLPGVGRHRELPLTSRRGNRCPFHCGRTERGCPHIPAPGLLLPGLLISREGLVNEVGSLQMLGLLTAAKAVALTLKADKAQRGEIKFL